MTVEIKGEKFFHAFWHSDEHTIHPHTPTQHILSNITALRKASQPETIDMDVWGGDLTHDATQTSDPDYAYLQNWIKSYLAERHNEKTLVRILAGTFSHDRNQPEQFDILKPENSPYIKYIDTLSIEYIEEFDIHCLYVPDNFGKKPKVEIYEDAVKLIASHGLKQVDFIFLHGAMDFQLPELEATKHSCYNSEAWSKLASKVILTGHVHKPSHKLNIYSSGSVDRIAHGEMHAKGAYNVYFNKKETICRFIENKNAMIYDTIEISAETTALEIHNVLDRYLEKRPMKGASIRLKGGYGGIVRPIIDEYTKSFPEYNFSAKNINEKGVVVDNLLYDPKNFKGTVIDEKNIEELVVNHLKSKEDPEVKSTTDYAYLSTLMKELING